MMCTCYSISNTLYLKTRETEKSKRKREARNVLQTPQKSKQLYTSFTICNLAVI